MVSGDRSGIHWPRWVRGLLLSVLFSVLLPATAHPDMGRITTSGVDVREDFHRAIIIHNLQEEILILATDIRADEKTTILRFIPFPSKPQVSLVARDPTDRRCFLSPGRGPCEALFWKYYFNLSTGSCEKFAWGGCGDVVPFKSKEECEEVCGVRPDVEPADNPQEEETQR